MNNYDSEFTLRQNESEESKSDNKLERSKVSAIKTWGNKMASIFLHNGVIRFLNIDGTVGTDGVNHPDDVYLVQVLFYEVLTNCFPNGGAKPPRIPTGIFTKDTFESMKTYKTLKNKEHAIIQFTDKVCYEKHIDPIKGSVFAFGTIHVWAMVQLNMDLATWLIHTTGFDHTEKYLCKKYPRLVAVYSK
jgi:hypothetical protein